MKVKFSKEVIHPRKAVFDAHSSSEIGSCATASVETANVGKFESCKGRF